MTFDKDYAGVFVSSLCLVHCIAGPVILALGLSTAGFSFFLDEKVHLALVAPIIVFALWSIPYGYKVHQKPLPLIAAAVGLLMLLLGLIIHEVELILTLSASSSIIVAHLFNKKLLKTDKPMACQR